MKVWVIFNDEECVCVTGNKSSAFEELVDIASETYRNPKRYIDGIMSSFCKCSDTDNIFGYDKLWARRVDYV